MSDTGIMRQDEYFKVLESVKKQIRSAQRTVMNTANEERNKLYWQIGKTIIDHSAWGNKFVQTLSKDLRIEYPSATGYSERNLNYMKQFAERIPSEEILQQVVAKINWRSITFLINQTENADEFVWYAGQTLEQGWSSNVLRHQIESGLYARQVLVDKTTNYKSQLTDPLGEQAEEIIKDPYVFDFIPAAAPLLEKDLEDAMVAQITRVLMEFGSGFSFLGRQYPIHVGEKDYYIDLLFYNVKLHCYFVVELKTVDFEPEFAGKLSFYLSAVDGELKSDLDNPTLGLLLCKSKDKVVAEYALQDINKPIGISEYRVSDKMNPAIMENLPSIEDIENRIKL